MRVGFFFMLLHKMSNIIYFHILIYSFPPPELYVQSVLQLPVSEWNSLKRTENVSFKERCQRETLILGPSLWQNGISQEPCSPMLHRTLHRSPLSGFVWGFVMLASKIHTSRDTFILPYRKTSKPSASCLQWHGCKSGT